MDKNNRPLNKLNITGVEIHANPIAEEEWDIEQEAKKEQAAKQPTV